MQRFKHTKPTSVSVTHYRGYSFKEITRIANIVIVRYKKCMGKYESKHLRKNNFTLFRFLLKEHTVVLTIPSYRQKRKFLDIAITKIERGKILREE